MAQITRELGDVHEVTTDIDDRAALDLMERARCASGFEVTFACRDARTDELLEHPDGLATAIAFVISDTDTPADAADTAAARLAPLIDAGVFGIVPGAKADRCPYGCLES